VGGPLSGLGLRQLVSCQVYFAAIQQFPLYLFARLPVRTLKSPVHPFNRQARPLQVPQRDPRRGPRSLSLAPKENAFRSVISRSNPKKPARWNAAYHESIHRDQSNLRPLDPEAFIQTALELLSNDRYLQKGLGLDSPDRPQACRDLL
jgi:hypothetical protein